MRGHDALKDMAENPGKVYRHKTEEDTYDFRFDEGYKLLECCSTTYAGAQWGDYSEPITKTDILADDWEEVSK